MTTFPLTPTNGSGVPRSISDDDYVQHCTSLSNNQQPPHLQEARLSDRVASFTWVRTDAGRSQSRRPRQTKDCTVRALASARGLTYDEAYDELKQAGRKCSRGFAIQVWLNAQPWALKLPFPAVKGERRMNPVTFVVQFPQGNFICRSSKHVFAVIDGKVLDTNKPRDGCCIYTAWKV